MTHLAISATNDYLVKDGAPSCVRMHPANADRLFLATKGSAAGGYDLLGL
jgi:hypothetical protein